MAESPFTAFMLKPCLQLQPQIQTISFEAFHIVAYSTTHSFIKTVWNIYIYQIWYMNKYQT